MSAMGLLLRWLWRRPCPVCERSRWPGYEGRLRQYAPMSPRCPAFWHRRNYARSRLLRARPDTKETL